MRHKFSQGGNGNQLDKHEGTEFYSPWCNFDAAWDERYGVDQGRLWLPGVQDPRAAEQEAEREAEGQSAEAVKPVSAQQLPSHQPNQALPKVEPSQKQRQKLMVRPLWFSSIEEPDSHAGVRTRVAKWA